VRVIVACHDEGRMDSRDMAKARVLGSRHVAESNGLRLCPNRRRHAHPIKSAGKVWWH
jgi:hypothetical protein